MLKYACLICFTNVLNVEGERPTYADLSDDGTTPTFRGTSSFSESGKAQSTGRTFQGGSSFLKDMALCHDEKEIMAEVFQDLGFRKLQGSYCQWPQVVCQECHVTELRLDLKQAQDSQDVPGQLSPALGRLRHLELLDLGGSSKLSGDLAVLRNATGLRTLNLSHNQVEGGLEVFQNHPKLKVLDLEGTMVEGSIEVFQFTPGLEVLKIGGAGEISGDIKVFEHTPNLKVLALNATALEGDMEVFSVYTKGIRQLSLINALRVTGHLPNLLKHRTFHNLKKFVLINSSGVTGSVKHFLAAKKLQEMRIENAEYINGDLSLLPIPSLRSLILKGITMEVDFTALDRKYRMKNPQFNLSELHLEPEVETSGSTRLLKLPARRQSRLAGDIAFLRHFPHLQVLNLRKSSISGDIKALRLDRMELLNLAATLVSGDIAVFQKAGKLQDLDLSRTPVEGDISSFSNSPDLRRLHIFETWLSGDIAVFQKTGKLQDLDLSRTPVEGDISSFSNSPDLRRLHIYETGLSGDIQVLQGAKKLQELLAWRTHLKGDIKVLSQVSASLSRISMGNTFVHGDLKSLSNATELKSLACTHCNVSGDIAALAQDTQLAQIWLAGTNISGDISALGNMMLEKVFLDRTKISGNIEIFSASRETVQLISLGNTYYVHGSMNVFQRAPKLQDLNLAGTRISGDLEILSDVTTLRHLRLDRCNVTGNISAINTESLEVLSLSETGVFGSLRALSGKAKLRVLKLAATTVLGELSDLTSLPEIEHVDLSGTNVTGSMNAEWDGHCKNLQYLDLSEIPAAVLPGEHVAQTVMNQGLEILPALTSLKVRGVDLNGTLISLFQLLSSSKLSSLVASRCGLSGDLIDLSSIRTLNRSSLRFIQESQLAKSLLHLDISNNSIEFVEALPPNAHIRIAFNKVKLRLAEGVLTQAFDEAFELDLRSTPLADFSEAQELFYAGRLKQTRFFGQTYEAKGYGCFSLDPGSTNVQIVSGDDFLPDKMCICLKGWFGNGTSCNRCGKNTYSNVTNAASCESCPPDSHTEKVGAKSRFECACTIGKSIKNGTACGCRELFALHDGVCVSCPELNLDCSTEGLIAITAPPQDGFARLEARAHRSYKCFQPSNERCNRSGGVEELCAPGYSGYLCMDCRLQYFASGGRCWPCNTSSDASNWRLWAAAGLEPEHCWQWQGRGSSIHGWRLAHSGFLACRGQSN